MGEKEWITNIVYIVPTEERLVSHPNWKQNHILPNKVSPKYWNLPNSKIGVSTTLLQALVHLAASPTPLSWCGRTNTQQPINLSKKTCSECAAAEKYYLEHF